MPPQHPVLLEKYQYFSAVTAGWKTGSIQPDKFSALTAVQWNCPQPVARHAHATHGVCTSIDVGFKLNLASDDGQTVAELSGQGVIIEDRDFATWRQQARDKTTSAWRASNPSTIAFEYAAPALVGLGNSGSSFVGEMTMRDGQPTTQALVTQTNGFHPGHAYHTGSGDHVNAGHLIEACLQLATMQLGANRPLYCSGGEAAFSRFVELGVPFEIRVISQIRQGTSHNLSFRITQLGRETTLISLSLVPEPSQ